MRIIGGTAGGRRLLAPRSSARPTADRVREAIFNRLLAHGAVARRVLDLYAGSGALGLEALSRGAESALFVDADRRSCEAIRGNGAQLGFAVEVVNRPVHSWLERASGRFGWIFIDPPYASFAELDRSLELLAEHRLVDEGGWVIAEHDWRSSPAAAYGSLCLTDCRRYGQTAVSFFTTSPTEEETGDRT